MTLNALSNVTVNITSSPLAKSFVDVKTGLTASLNCISFAFSTVKLLFAGEKGRRYIVRNCCKYCYNIIYQKTPLYLKEYEDKLKDKGISKFRYDFTFESIEEVKAVLSGKYNGIYDEGHITNGVE